jgi:hypothetical protein
VRLPSGAGHWTVLDEDLAVVAVADSFLRQLRFGRDGAESTTKAYAGGIALFLVSPRLARLRRFSAAVWRLSQAWCSAVPR